MQQVGSNIKIGSKLASRASQVLAIFWSPLLIAGAHSVGSMQLMTTKIRICSKLAPLVAQIPIHLPLYVSPVLNAPKFSSTLLIAGATRTRICSNLAPAQVLIPEIVQVQIPLLP